MRASPNEISEGVMSGTLYLESGKSVAITKQSPAFLYGRVNFLSLKPPSKQNAQFEELPLLLGRTAPRLRLDGVPKSGCVIVHLGMIGEICGLMVV